MDLILILLYLIVQQAELRIAEDVCSMTEVTATTVLQRFFSPNFPNNYPNNVDCITKITSPENTVIELAFDSFQLEDSENCVNDFLEITGNVVDRLMYPSCGRSFGWPYYPDKIVSRSNDMTIAFVTDERISDLGFNATFRAGYAQTTTFTPKNDPRPTSLTIYLIIAIGSILLALGVVAVTVLGVAVCTRRRRYGCHNRNQAVDNATLTKTDFNRTNVTDSAHLMNATNFSMTPMFSVSGGSVRYTKSENYLYYRDQIDDN